MKINIKWMIMMAVAVFVGDTMASWAAVSPTIASGSEVQSFFDGATGFLTRTVGTGVFITGLTVAGIKIAAGDHGGMKNAVMVMIGGAVIFLAKSIVEILSGLATR